MAACGGGTAGSGRAARQRFGADDRRAATRRNAAGAASDRGNAGRPTAAAALHGARTRADLRHSAKPDAYTGAGADAGCKPRAGRDFGIVRGREYRPAAPHRLVGEAYVRKQGLASTRSLLGARCAAAGRTATPK